MIEDARSASQSELGWNFPRYRDATLGFRHYWYPVTFATALGKRPKAFRLLGEDIVFFRDQGRIHALQDRCPHRGVPLSAGVQEWPGTITCIYHGWTYDLATGRLVAVLTDGPDSPICGRANVRTYPVEERAGLVWVYIGDAPAPPVEQDIPSELLRPNMVIEGTVQLRRGNWRYAAENGVDEGHAKYLHRRGLWTIFRELPAWNTIRMEDSADGEWLVRVPQQTEWADEFPVVGRWPRQRHFWQSRNRGATEVGIRLPCWLRVRQRGWTGYEIYVPADADHYHYLLLATVEARGLEAAWFRAKYRLWLRWVYHGQFNSQDQWAIEHMKIPPERLYRPDMSITAWRKLCQEQAREGPPAPAPAVTAGEPADAPRAV